MAQAKRAVSVAAKQAAPPVDLVQLATSTMGNRDLELQILQMFRTQSRDMLARLSRESDPGARKDLAHTLKGSARALGAAGVASACQSIEDALNRGEEPPLAALAQAVDEATVYIDSLVS
ncbi:hypothetical protein GCM10011316_06600 [Roseibium aquae]|uniref:HPt domain-containing protein n=1 Tax=Roseibium aquae TaxID=1323746 RepID=A0A916TA08_9HYPH|nr:Hpt domain-containing protein [Roseibium aquae]GGB37173.1 hypothetical protein GCM10011316_06600 [Roseibium aquae]